MYLSEFIMSKSLMCPIALAVQTAHHPQHQHLLASSLVLVWYYCRLVSAVLSI